MRNAPLAQLKRRGDKLTKESEKCECSNQQQRNKKYVVKEMDGLRRQHASSWHTAFLSQTERYS